MIYLRFKMDCGRIMRRNRRINALVKKLLDQYETFEKKKYTMYIKKATTDVIIEIRNL
jgi:hypothetical protein